MSAEGTRDGAPPTGGGSSDTTAPKKPTLVLRRKVVVTTTRLSSERVAATEPATAAPAPFSPTPDGAQAYAPAPYDCVHSPPARLIPAASPSGPASSSRGRSLSKEGFLSAVQQYTQQHGRDAALLWIKQCEQKLHDAKDRSRRSSLASSSAATPHHDGAASSSTRLSASPSASAFDEWLSSHPDLLRPKALLDPPGSQSPQLRRCDYQIDTVCGTDDESVHPLDVDRSFADSPYSSFISTAASPRKPEMLNAAVATGDGDEYSFRTASHASSYTTQRDQHSSRSRSITPKKCDELQLQHHHNRKGYFYYHFHDYGVPPSAGRPEPSLSPPKALRIAYTPTSSRGGGGGGGSVSCGRRSPSAPPPTPEQHLVAAPWIARHKSPVPFRDLHPPTPTPRSKSCGAPGPTSPPQESLSAAAAAAAAADCNQSEPKGVRHSGYVWVPPRRAPRR